MNIYLFSLFCLNCICFAYSVNSSLCSFSGLLSGFRGLFEIFHGDLCMTGGPSTIHTSIHPSILIRCYMGRKKYTARPGLEPRTSRIPWSSVVRVLSRYARGPGFETRSGRVLFPPL